MEASQIVLKLVLETIGQELDLANFDQRLALQKKLYLAQLTGIDLGYRFRWYLYGPYCTELFSDAFRLQDDIDRADNPDNETLKPDVTKKLSRAKDIWEGKPEEVDDAVWLELLASVHYLKHIAYMKSEERSFETVFDALVKSKPRFCDRRALVEKAWDQLYRVGLIDSKMLPVA